MQTCPTVGPGDALSPRRAFQPLKRCLGEEYKLVEAKECLQCARLCIAFRINESVADSMPGAGSAGGPSGSKLAKVHFLR